MDVRKELDFSSNVVVVIENQDLDKVLLKRNLCKKNNISITYLEISKTFF